MKGFLSIMMIGSMLFLGSCNEETASIEVKGDSLLDKIENKAEALYDSTKENVKEFGNKADSALDARREKEDTAH